MELKQLHTSENDLVIAFAESRIGGRSENQDSCGGVNLERGFLITVCDGMGGGPGGKTASTIAVQEIVAGVEEADAELPATEVLIQAVKRANASIYQHAQDNKEMKGMGSTATVVLISEQSACVAHVGDSRVYQFRGKEKIFRTFDHSMVFELVREGVITEEQARLSAQSNVITRALGIRPDVEVEVHELPFEKGDRIMLTTDGIHGSMPEKKLIKLATQRKTVLGTQVDNIATIVDHLGLKSGGHHDNLTLAIAETKVNSKLKPKMTKRAKFMLAILSIICLVWGIKRSG